MLLKIRQIIINGGAVRKVADKVQHSRPLIFRPILLFCRVREALSGAGFLDDVEGEMGVDLYAQKCDRGLFYLSICNFLHVILANTLFNQLNNKPLSVMNDGEEELFRWLRIWINRSRRIFKEEEEKSELTVI